MKKIRDLGLLSIAAVAISACTSEQPQGYLRDIGKYVLEGHDGSFDQNGIKIDAWAEENTHWNSPFGIPGKIEITDSERNCSLTEHWFDGFNDKEEGWMSTYERFNCEGVDYWIDRNQAAVAQANEGATVYLASLVDRLDLN